MRIFVVGVGGQLGSSLKDLIIEDGGHAFKGTTHAELDITDAAECEKQIRAFKADAVVNASAYNNVDLAESEQSKAFAVNKQGPAQLARITSSLGIGYVHVSTDYVFDGKSTRPYLESDKTNPLSAYARSKYEGEVEVFREHPTAFVVRTAWVFKESGSNFVTKMLECAKKGEIKVTADQISSPTYAPHLARGVLSLVTRETTPGLYHMAGGGAASRYELMKMIFEGLGIRTPITPVPADYFPSPAKRPKYSPLASERIHFHQMPPWELGVADFLEEAKHGMRIP